MHLLVFCRVHPGEQELAPLGESGGVYNTMEEVEAVLDSMCESRHVFDEQWDEDGIDPIEFRGPGYLAIQTMQASDERSKEFGGDGRCHRVFQQVWCIGDPDECREDIHRAATMKVVSAMPMMLSSEDPDVRALALRGMMDLISRAAGIDEDDEGEVEDEHIMRLPPIQPEFGTSLANEPFDDLFDFGGFDEPTNKKRLN